MPALLPTPYWYWYWYRYRYGLSGKVQVKITYLGDLSLEGDIPNDISDVVEVREKHLFTGN
jgi:hypothetical protein